MSFCAEKTITQLGLHEGDYAIVRGKRNNVQLPAKLVQLGTTFRPGSLATERRVRATIVADGSKTDYDSGCRIFRRPGLVTRAKIRFGLI